MTKSSEGKGIKYEIMICKDNLGRIWEAPIFGNPSKEEKLKQELVFRKYIFNHL
jgi:hypothetical protein